MVINAGVSPRKIPRAFGRKELSLAEHEMPGHVARRTELGPAKSFLGLNTDSSLHLTTTTGALIETSNHQQSLHGETAWQSRSRNRGCSEVLHRTTANEPLTTVQQTPGQKGFEAWHAIVMRLGQRNMSDNNSAHAAWIRNISERDRTTDVEQINDILRTFICETNKFESRFGIITYEEEMFADKKMMLESLLKFRFEERR